EPQIVLKVVFFEDHLPASKLRHKVPGGFPGLAERADQRGPVRAVRVDGPNRPGAHVSQPLGFEAREHEAAVSENGGVKGAVNVQVSDRLEVGLDGASAGIVSHGSSMTNNCSVEPGVYGLVAANSL